MSLSNPNKPVTEQRLADFFNKIKGYLGYPVMPDTDMPEVLTPLPSVMSRRMKYSTEEQVAGEWVDGKPLYQKTIVDTTNDTINVSKYISIGASVDKCVLCNGVFLNTDNIFIPLPFFANSVTNNNIAALKVVANPNNASSNKNTIGLVCSSSNFLNRPVYVTIQYTKTTD